MNHREMKIKTTTRYYTPTRMCKNLKDMMPTVDKDMELLELS